MLRMENPNGEYLGLLYFDDLGSCQRIYESLSAIKKEHASALSALRNAVTNNYRLRIVDFAAKSRLPAMYPDREFVEIGGLMSYGPKFADLFRRAATYVDKIRKGSKPADLPVEQPTKFELVINLKTAKANRLNNSVAHAPASRYSDQVKKLSALTHICARLPRPL